MKRGLGPVLIILFMFMPGLLLISSDFVASAFGCVAAATGGFTGCAHANALALAFFLASFFSFITVPMGVFILLVMAAGAWVQARKKKQGIFQPPE